MPTCIASIRSKDSRCASRSMCAWAVSIQGVSCPSSFVRHMQSVVSNMQSVVGRRQSVGASGRLNGVPWLTRSARTSTAAIRSSCEARDALMAFCVSVQRASSVALSCRPTCGNVTVRQLE